jgi:hypothetical protein
MPKADSKEKNLETINKPVSIPEGTVLSKDSPILKTGIETKSQGPSVLYQLSDKEKRVPKSKEDKTAATESSGKVSLPSATTSTVSTSAAAAATGVEVLISVAPSTSSVPPPPPPPPPAPAIVYEPPPVHAPAVVVVNNISDDDEMAEGGNSFLPSPFTGTGTENPQRFIDALELYCEFKNINDQAKKNQLLKLRLAGDAAEWLASIPAGEKDTFDHLKASFEARYYPKELSKFSYARLLFQAKQQPLQSCDDFIVQIRKNAGIAGVVDEKSLIFAAISGFLPEIASYVMEKNPATMGEVQTHARTAELTKLKDPARDSTLSLQMAEMKSELSRLASKFDKSVNAVSPSRSRSSTPDRRRVSFSESDNQSQRTQQSEYSQQRYRGNEQQQKRSQYRPSFQRNNNFQPRNAQYGTRYNDQNNASGVQQEAKPVCFRCGNRHDHPLKCPMLNKVCYFCGISGHSIKMCRKRKASLNGGNFL